MLRILVLPFFSILSLLMFSGLAASQSVTIDKVLQICQGSPTIFGQAQQGRASFNNGVTVLKDGNTIRYYEGGNLIEELKYSSVAEYENCVEKFSRLFGLSTSSRDFEDGVVEVGTLCNNQDFQEASLRLDFLWDIADGDESMESKLNDLDFICGQEVLSRELDIILAPRHSGIYIYANQIRKVPFAGTISIERGENLEMFDWDLDLSDIPSRFGCQSDFIDSEEDFFAMLQCISSGSQTVVVDFATSMIGELPQQQWPVSQSCELDVDFSGETEFTLFTCYDPSNRQFGCQLVEPFSSTEIDTRAVRSCIRGG